MLGSIEDLKVDSCNCYVVNRISRQLEGEAVQHRRLCLGFQKKSKEDFHFGEKVQSENSVQCLFCRELL